MSECSPWKRCLTTREAADYLGLSIGTLRAWRMRGPDDPGAGPRFIRLTATKVVYRIEALDEYLQQKSAATDRARGMEPLAAA